MKTNPAKVCTIHQIRLFYAELSGMVGCDDFTQSHSHRHFVVLYYNSPTEVSDWRPRGPALQLSLLFNYEAGVSLLFSVLDSFWFYLYPIVYWYAASFLEKLQEILLFEPGLPKMQTGVSSTTDRVFDISIYLHRRPKGS